MVRDLAEQGEWPEEWAGACGATIRTLRNWRNAHPEFHDDLVIARTLLAAYWAKYLRTHMLDMRLRQTALMRQLERRLPEIYGPQDKRDPHPIWEELGLTGHEEVAAPGTVAASPRIRGMAKADLLAELEVLRERRRVMDEQSGAG